MQWGLHHTAMGIWADMFLVALNFQQDLIDLVNWQKVDKLQKNRGNSTANKRMHQGQYGSTLSSMHGDEWFGSADG